MVKRTPVRGLSTASGSAKSHTMDVTSRPVAGLAAGLGLAALASHLGFGEGLANFMMIALLAMLAIGVIGFFMRKKAGAQAQGMQYAGAGAGAGGGMNSPRPEFTPMGGSAGAPAAAHASEPTAQNR